VVRANPHLSNTLSLALSADRAALLDDLSLASIDLSCCAMLRDRSVFALTIESAALSIDSAQ